MGESMPRWVRSWPAVIPPHRAYVQDFLPRLVLSDYDYAPLADLDEDICIIEWDMALEAIDQDRFMRWVARTPDKVIVAPYRLYSVAPWPVYAHRTVDAATGWERWVREADHTCHYFGFGCIYLPRDLVRAFLDAEAPARGRSPFLQPEQGYTDCRLHDQTFSIWHHHHAKRPDVRIAWDVRPVHLHS